MRENAGKMQITITLNKGTEQSLICLHLFLSISAFKIDKSDFAANLDVSTPVVCIKWLFFHN